YRLSLTGHDAAALEEGTRLNGQFVMSNVAVNIGCGLKTDLAPAAGAQYTASHVNCFSFNLAFDAAFFADDTVRHFHVPAYRTLEDKITCADDIAFDDNAAGDGGAFGLRLAHNRLRRGGGCPRGRRGVFGLCRAGRRRKGG